MESIALAIGGVLAPFIINWIKGATGWSRHLALGLAVFVSLVIAVIAIMVSGGTLEWTNVGTVFAVATVVYNLFTREG